MIRMNFPPQFREILLNFGNSHIKNMVVCRTPIEKTIDAIANVISFGNWEKAKEKLNYDNMFHLFLVIRLDDDLVFRLEKNQVLNLEKIDTRFLEQKNLQRMDIDLRPNVLPPQNFTNMLNSFLSDFGPENLFLYDAQYANCQDFITKLLESNGLLEHSGQIGVVSQNELIYKFINQDATALLDSLPGFSRFLISASTTAAAIVDRIRYGARISDGNAGGNPVSDGNAGGNPISNDNPTSDIQALLFDRKYWTTLKCRNWMAAHKIKAIDKVEQTENFLRYKINDSDKFESFTVKKTDNHMDIVIGFYE